MATVEFNCGRCGKHYSLDAAMAGKKARCKQCGHVFAVPAPGPADVFGLDDLASAAAGPAVARPRPDEDDEFSPPPRARTAAKRPQSAGGSKANTQTVKTAAGVGSFLVAFGLIFCVRVLLRTGLNAAIDGANAPAEAEAEADDGPSPPVPARPPMPPPPAAPALPKTRAHLSNGSAFPAPGRLGRPGRGVAFRLEFRFDDPGPIGGLYLWVVESSKGIARNPMPLHSRQGTLAGSVSTMSPEDGPFTAYIAFQQGNQFEKVSDPLVLNSSEQPPEPQPQQTGAPGRPHMGGPPPGFPPHPGGPPPGPRFGPRGPRFGPRGPRGGPP